MESSTSDEVGGGTAPSPHFRVAVLRTFKEGGFRSSHKVKILDSGIQASETYSYLGCVEFSELFKNPIHLGITLLQTIQNQR